MVNRLASPRDLRADAARLREVPAPCASHARRRYAADAGRRLRHAARSGRPLVKIVQALGWYYPDSLGGTEVYVNALANRFRTYGHQVAIAAPQVGASGPQTYVHDGCDVYRYPIPAAPTRDEAQGRVPARGAEHLHRWLENAGADVVHVHTFVTGLGLHEVAAARRAARRVIVTTHASSLGFLCQRGTLMWRGVSLCDGIVDRVRCASCALEHRGAGPTMAALVGRVPPAGGRP